MRIVFFASLLLVTALDGAQAVWPAARGSAQGGATVSWEDPSVLEEWHYAWKTRVRYTPGMAVWASPALAILDGRPVAFIGGFDQTLHALDLPAKRVLWRHMTNAGISAAPVIGRIQGRTSVFFTSNDRTLYALDALAGTVRWTHEMEPVTPTQGDADFTSPLLWRDRLYVAGFVYDRSLTRNDQRARLYAVDPASGRLLWRFDIGQGFVSEPIGWTADGTDYIAVAARKGLLQCFIVDDKIPRLAWDYQMPHEVLGAPVVETGVPDPVLVLGSKYGNLIALDASTGRERWKRMAGNWFDNSACIGRLDGTNVVFAGSHDYAVYALRAADGALLWRRSLGGEVHTAPVFFDLDGTPAVLVAALDNHLHVLDARTGRIITSYFTGRPIWDKINKGENRWGSPAVIEAGPATAALHGSFNGSVYLLPLVGTCTLQARARSVRGLWLSLGFVALIFTLALPVLARVTPPRGSAGMPPV